eukprot:353608-Chlamydomonas_euryale.AAC.2
MSATKRRSHVVTNADRNFYLNWKATVLAQYGPYCSNSKKYDTKYNTFCIIRVRLGCQPCGAQGSVSKAVHPSLGTARAPDECRDSATTQINPESQ